MTPENILVTAVAVLVGIYGVAALVAYLRKHWSELVLPGAEDLAPAAAGPVKAPVATPGDPRAQQILREWFAGKSCAICSQAIPPIHRLGPHPGLMNGRSPAPDLIPWEGIMRNEHLPALLESHAPVCSNCMMAETFRREFPDLVVDRPEHGRHPH